MNFTHDNKKYRLTFYRESKKLKLRRDNREKEITSKYPYTIAKLYALPDGSEPIVVGKGTVGCYKTDTYCKRLGAYYALVKLGNALKEAKWPKEFRRALWRAYLNRGNAVKNTPPGSANSGDVVDAESVTEVAPTENNGFGTALLPSDVTMTGEVSNGWAIH